jgi:type II secretory pathway component PulC
MATIFKLNGILEIDGKRAALLNDGDQTVVIKANEDVNGYQVSEITSDSIVFVKGQTQVKVRMEDT